MVFSLFAIQSFRSADNNGPLTQGLPEETTGQIKTSERNEKINFFEREIDKHLRSIDWNNTTLTDNSGAGGVLSGWRGLPLYTVRLAVLSSDNGASQRSISSRTGKNGSLGIVTRVFGVTLKRVVGCSPHGGLLYPYWAGISVRDHWCLFNAGLWGVLPEAHINDRERRIW